MVAKVGKDSGHRAIARLDWSSVIPWPQIQNYIVNTSCHQVHNKCVYTAGYESDLGEKY